MTFRMCANLVGVSILVALSSLSPRISEEIQRGAMSSTAIRLLHLYSFGTWIGMQFWVSFVAGEKTFIIQLFILSGSIARKISKLNDIFTHTLQSFYTLDDRAFT